MRKLTVLLMAGLIAVSTLIPVHAQPDTPIVTEWQNGIPYDAAGDKIEVEGKRWIYDSTLEKPMFQLVDKEYNVLEQRETTGMKDPTDHDEGENIVVDDEEAYGWLTLQAELPEEIDGKDVLVSIQGDGGSGDYRLIKQNGYELTVQLPVGTYEIQNASIDGDLALTYSCDFTSDIEIRENDGANTYLSFEKGNLLNSGKTDKAIILDEEPEKDTRAEKVMILLYILLGLIIILSGLFVVLLIRSRRDPD